MTDKHDTYLTVLHKLRQIKGVLRQSSHKDALRKLQKELSDNIKEPHPYRLVVNDKIDQIKPLLGVPEFRSGAAGAPAAPSSEYIYHLTSVRKVIGDPNSKLPRTLTWTYFPPAFPNLYEPDLKIFECLFREYNDVYSGKGWMHLKDYATGEYSVKRDFTWWTNEEFRDVNIICAAHRIGLPNTWIPKYALVMRCMTNKLAKTLSHVPTALDGFTSEIFSPADHRAGPPVHGEAINLDSSRLLSTDAEEYALKPITAESIQFRPVLIDNRKRRQHVVNRNTRLWQLLEIYYYNL
jgi:hypothetical protein